MMYIFRKDLVSPPEPMGHSAAIQAEAPSVKV